MATAFVSPFVGHSFAATAMQEILDHPIEGETASHRMKQIGFLCFVHQLQLAGMETTISHIMAVTGLQRTSVVEFATPLVKRNLLVEHNVKNATGRGRATMLTVSPAFLQRIVPIA